MQEPKNVPKPTTKAKVLYRVGQLWFFGKQDNSVLTGDSALGLVV